jgi:hypothetical protein
VKISTGKKSLPVEIFTDAENIAVQARNDEVEINFQNKWVSFSKKCAMI